MISGILVVIHIYSKSFILIRISFTLALVVVSVSASVIISSKNFIEFYYYPEFEINVGVLEENSDIFSDFDKS
jgi:hypothetical protein